MQDKIKNKILSFIISPPKVINNKITFPNFITRLKKLKWYNTLYVIYCYFSKKHMKIYVTYIHLFIGCVIICLVNT